MNELLYGLSIVLTPENLMYCFAGVVIGTLVGVMPGLGPVATMSLLYPSTIHLPPVSGMIMMSAVFYGAMYGGSTTSILLNMPGEAASVVTTLDGYQMAKQGRAGPALGISAFGSFIGGTLSVVALMLIAPSLARAALRFGFPEYFALMASGMVILTFMSSGSMLKSLMMVAFGSFLGTIGMDMITGTPRFTFGIQTVMENLGVVPVVMGLFGISEVFLNIEQGVSREVFAKKISNIYPSLKDWNESIGAIVRGTGLGFFLGILPGAGAIVASLTSYAIEKKVSKHPEKFGTGMIAGVAGPETANNAAVGAGFIPLLTLAVPASPALALLLGFLMSYGVQVGPLLMTENRDVFWGVIMSMYSGNIMLLILNLPLIGIWIKVLKIPYVLLFPLILLLCVIGAYSINNNPVEVVIMIVFGVIGYLMKKFDYAAAPLMMAMILSPLMERNLRQSLLLSHGDFTIFFTRPLSAILMGVAIILLIVAVLPAMKARIWERMKES